MRISDWSSDVCSSDLLVDRDEADARIAQPRRDRADAGDNIPRGAAAPRCRLEREIVDIIAIRLRRDGAEQAVELRWLPEHRRMADDGAHDTGAAAQQEAAAGGEREENGRRTGRERVGPYV